MKKAINFLKKSDPILKRIIEEAGPYTLETPKGFTPYRSLIRSITYQQLHGKAAETIFKRFIALYPNNRFPTPEQILKTPMKKLRSAGLSESKAKAILDVAEKAVAKVIPSSRAMKNLSDEEIIKRLTQVRGIGTWTVQMLLMFQLGRVDVLPIDDFGVRNGFALAYKKSMPKPKELLQFGEQWKPYRTIASWYLWRAVDLAREKKKSEKKSSLKTGEKSKNK